MNMNNYAHPEFLVDTQWVADNLQKSNLQKNNLQKNSLQENSLQENSDRLIEVDIDGTNYNKGHLPGAIFWNILQVTLKPDFGVNFDEKSVENLLSQSGITKDTTIILYSANSAVAAFVFWYLQGFGHKNIKILNGGSKKWLAEGHQLVTDIPTIAQTEYQVNEFNQNQRADFDTVFAAMKNNKSVLIDVRTPQEFCGEFFAMKQPPEGNQRGGHIPGAIYLPFESALQEDDDTFKELSELKALYESKGITPEKEIITYCAVGIRASHTWFVLKYLLGYQNVRNYDASWNEWGHKSDTRKKSGRLVAPRF
jgi:thiosulfate/3-mercaptopyruvate sulfurtransferase